ncbi:MAG: M28 family peptidase [Methanobacteriota archaeon]|nr:MAG: M28 family peptidase [Euryarchaeota archaeon]
MSLSMITRRQISELRDRMKGLNGGLRTSAVGIAAFMLIASIVPVIGGAPVDTLAVSAGSVSLSEEELALLGMRDVETVKSYTEYLSDGLGEKMVGSPEEWSGQQYVYDKLSALNLDSVTWETFDSSSWSHSGDRMVIVSNGVEIPCTIYGYCYGIWGEDGGVPYFFGNSEDGKTLQALLVDAGTGDRADFDALGEDLHGAIALVYRDDDRTVWPNVMNDEAFLHNASATIAYGYYTSLPVDPDGIKQDDCGGTIPYFSISSNSAAYLQELLSQGPVELRLEGRANMIAYGSVQSSNVAGYLIGSAYPDEYVVIGSHIDTFWNGTWDTVGGVAILIELARIFSEARDAGTFTNERTLVFVCVGAEESGGPDDTWFSWLVGSYEFYVAHPEIADGMVMELNMDGVTLAKPSGQYWAETSHELNDFFNELTIDLGHQGIVSLYNPLWSWTDAWIYGGKAGSSACQLWWVVDQESIYHTQLDDMDLYSSEAVNLTMDYYTVMAARASNAVVYPLNFLPLLDWFEGFLISEKAAIPYEASLIDEASAALDDLREETALVNAYAAQLLTDYDGAVSPVEKATIRAKADWLNSCMREARRLLNHWGIGEGGTMASWETFLRPEQHANDLEQVDHAIAALNQASPGSMKTALSALAGVYSMEWGHLVSNWTYHNTMQWMINPSMYWGDDWDQQQAYIDVHWIYDGLASATLSRTEAVDALTKIKEGQLIPWLEEDLLKIEWAFSEAGSLLELGMNPEVPEGPPYSWSHGGPWLLASVRR